MGTEDIQVWQMWTLTVVDDTAATQTGYQDEHLGRARETCPECKPLRKEKTKTARCCTPAFQYQCHFDGYVEMSEEYATLFWEVNIDPSPNHECASAGPTLPDRAAMNAEKAAPEQVIPIRSLPKREPDDSRCTDAGANPMDDSQDTKPVESARLAHRWDRTGDLADDIYTPRPLYLQATISTQTDETNQPRTETFLENKTPPSPIETTKAWQGQPKSIRTKRKGRGRADLDTPDGPEAEFEDNLWATLPFAEATWRPTYRVRAVTSADDVDPRVQEVLDLPALNLSAAQEEDPDLVCMKELLRYHDIRLPWNAVREESAEVKILWTQFHRLKVQENVLYRRRKKNCSQPPMASGGSQASPIPDLQGLSSPCHGCSPRSSENYCLNKETFLLAENAEKRGSLM